jgi:hypothetical protein
MKITIESFDNNSYVVTFEKNEYVIDWKINLGDGPLPDWTSVVQGILELDNPVKESNDNIDNKLTSNYHTGDSLNEDTMKAAHMESETARWIESFKSIF